MGHKRGQLQGRGGGCPWRARGTSGRSVATTLQHQVARAGPAAEAGARAGGDDVRRGCVVHLRGGARARSDLGGHAAGGCARARRGPEARGAGSGGGHGGAHRREGPRRELLQGEHRDRGDIRAEARGGGAWGSGRLGADAEVVRVDAPGRGRGPWEHHWPRLNRVQGQGGDVRGLGPGEGALHHLCDRHPVQFVEWQPWWPGKVRFTVRETVQGREEGTNNPEVALPKSNFQRANSNVPKKSPSHPSHFSSFVLDGAD